MLSLKVRLKLDYKQKLIIDTLSNEHRLLYNYLLEQMHKRPCSFKELNDFYRNYRNSNNLTISSKSAQNTCISLVNNIKSFYVLHKKDPSAKFPYKFKSHKYFKSFTYDINNGLGGFSIVDNILTINLKNRYILNIQLPNICYNISTKNIKTMTFSGEGEDRYVTFTYAEDKKHTKQLNHDKFLSIDLGYSKIVTCYSNATENFSVDNQKQKQLETRIETVQSKRDHKKKGSTRYNKLAKTHRRLKRKKANKSTDFHHKLSSLIVKKCVENSIGNLVVGDLKVKKVQSKENKKISGSSKSTGLGRFKTFLEYKSKSAAMKYHSPNEAFTSQQNCLTGEIMFSSDLSSRSVEVRRGLFVDRDLNSAVNIAKKVRGEWRAPESDLSLTRMHFDNCTSKLMQYDECEYRY